MDWIIAVDKFFLTDAKKDLNKKFYLHSTAKISRVPHSSIRVFYIVCVSIVFVFFVSMARYRFHFQSYSFWTLCRLKDGLFWRSILSFDPNCNPYTAVDHTRFNNGNSNRYSRFRFVHSDCSRTQPFIRHPYSCNYFPGKFYSTATLFGGGEYVCARVVQFSTFCSPGRPKLFGKTKRRETRHRVGAITI